MAAGLVALASSVHAVPYACDITNSAGVVSFRLNENADNVRVVSGGGAVTNDLGPGIKGLTVTNLGIGAGAIKVMVSRSVPVGYTQISNDSYQDNGIYVNKFEHPRGIVVNKNPATPSFGRIYVSCARARSTASPVRANLDGIYLINSDNTVALDTGTTPRTAGLDFYVLDTETASPLRLTIGKDDNQLYICDLSDPKGGLWVTDLDVTSGTNVLDHVGDLGTGGTTHGSIYATWVEGSLATANLTVYTVDEDLTPIRSTWRYDIGAGPLPFTGSGTLLGQSMINSMIDLVRGGSSNYLYATQNRSTGNDAASIRIFKTDGTIITNSLDYTRTNLNSPSAVDYFRNTTALDISPDGTTLALLRGAAFGRVYLVPLTNGLPDMTVTNFFSYGAAASDNTRDIAYDAAGNIYVVSSASEWLRIFSKGGATVAITGTDGSFQMGVPPTIVSASNSVATANEQGPVNGVFTITRVGDTSVPLTVNYVVTGTATAGSDYTALPGSVTFAPGAATTNISVAVINDTEAELTETVILTVSGSASYGVVGGTATVSILDNEPTEVSLTLAQTESRLLEGFAGSKVGLQLTRRGSNAPALTVNLGYSGTAVRGTHYNGPTSANIGANGASVTINLTPINNEVYEGNKTAIVSVAAGTGYAIAATNVANASIIDDEFPAGTVLFSDNFETNSSSLWVVNSTDNGLDSAAIFAYDYSQVYVPPAPGGSSTLGLRFHLNFATGAPRNAISASPLGLTLPGDYRLKFHMWNNYNGPMFDGGSGSTMHSTAGVGTTPDHANLATSGGSDGVWFDVDGDGGSTFAVGDIGAYQEFTLQNDASGVYAAGTTNNPRSTTHPYYALWGNIPAPAAQLANFPTQTGTAQPGNMGVAWHTVYVTKTNNTVTLVIDGILIATVPSDSIAMGPNVFVGFEDIFPGASANTNMSFALVDNLRVETLAAPPVLITITDIKIIAGNVEVTFTGPANLTASAFTLQSSITVGSGYGDISSTPTDIGPGVFKLSALRSGDIRFYRIKL